MYSKVKGIRTPNTHSKTVKSLLKDKTKQHIVRLNKELSV